MKTIQNVIGLILLLLTINNVFADDIDILYDRYWELSINNPSKTSVDELLALLNPDGSFSDLNYTSSTANLSVHLNRLKSFGGAYQSHGNTYYHSDSIKTKYYKSLQYWITKNQTPSNWWYRHIAYPKAFGPALFLMNVEMQAEMPTLFDDAIYYLRWAYRQYNYMSGANGADKIYGAYPASILTKSDYQLKDYQYKIKTLMAVQNLGEGIEVDWMYGQHSFYGRQLYANYEHEYLNSILHMLDICKGTIYNVSDYELTILDNHFINGNQWYVYNNHEDPCQTGRVPTSSLNGRFTHTLYLLLGLNTPQKSQIEIVQDRILNGSKAASKLVGNRMFWRFDYMIHRRENYYVSSRLTSTRTVGMESGNGEGINNYYGGSGLNFLFRTGNEYDYPYFKVMNYRQWPGITVEQDDNTLPLVNWGMGGTNGNAFAGGVSDGFNGAIGTIYSKRRVVAYKSWFYFDDEFVALGNGITESRGSASIFTTINQALQKSNIIYSENNIQHTIESASGIKTVTNPDWVLQDSIGYINLLPTSNYKINSDNRNGTNIFTVGIDHGINPSDATYAYAVYPNASTESIANNKANPAFQILSNTKTVQAVYHKTLKITQAIFYTAGSVTLADGKVLTVNVPSAVLVKDTASTYHITVGNPKCNSSNPLSIVLTINTPLNGTGITWDGTKSSINIALPRGNYAGKSVSTIAYPGNSTPVFASSDASNADICIYPNPTNQNITVSFGMNKINAIEIYNETGQSVYSKKLSKTALTSESFDISELQQGAYFIKVYTDNGEVIKKIIKN